MSVGTLQTHPPTSGAAYRYEPRREEQCREWPSRNVACSNLPGASKQGKELNRRGCGVFKSAGNAWEGTRQRPS